MNVLLYSSSFPPRLAYVCQQVFTEWLGWSIEWTNDKTKYQNYPGIKINYSTSRLVSNDFLLSKSKLLFENGVKNQSFFPIVYNKIPALFPTKTVQSIFPFDLLATIFFHLSRYEEYLPFQADQHNRFSATESWAYQNSCLQKPIVNILVELLKERLARHFPKAIFKQQHFQYLPTYDVDMAWAFRYKGLKRQIGGYFNDLLKGQFLNLKNRIKTNLLLQEDPFQTFGWLASLSRKHQLNPLYFFLMSEHGQYDKNNLVSTPAFQELIADISNIHPVGIHPSYQSTNDPSIIRKEKERLAVISQQTINRSRQHYLKLHLPKTYQQLIAAGITQDYSMGYAMETGFRAGTALPFYWYDLEMETSTKLKIYPFQVMDVTLKEYLKFTPIEAEKRIQELLAITRSVNGVFCSLWHNSSFSELGNWTEWKAVYASMVESAVMST